MANSLARLLLSGQIGQRLSLSSRRYYVLSYAAQTVSFATTFSSTVLLGLILGPHNYATFLALVGTGYLSTTVIDQLLNTALAFEVGAGQEGVFKAVIASKALVAVPLILFLSFVFWHGTLSLAIGLWLGMGTALTSTLDLWLLTSGRPLASAIFRTTLGCMLVGAVIGLGRLGAVPVALGIATAYSVTGLASAAGAFATRKSTQRLRRVGGWTTLVLSAVLLSAATYSWLIPLSLIRLGELTRAANYRMAISVLLAVVALAPVPPGLVGIAIGASSAKSAFSDYGSVRRALLFGVITSIVAPVIVSLNSPLASYLLRGSGYAMTVGELSVVTLGLFPLLVNPMLCALLYASSAGGIRSPWLTLLGYLLIYAMSVAVAWARPNWVDWVLPVGQWVAFGGLALGTWRLWPRWLRARDLAILVPVTITVSAALATLGLPPNLRTVGGLGASVIVFVTAGVSVYGILRSHSGEIGQANRE